MYHIIDCLWPSAKDQHYCLHIIYLSFAILPLHILHLLPNPVPDVADGVEGRGEWAQVFDLAIHLVAPLDVVADG